MMKVYICLLAALLVMSAPAQALLGAKLVLGKVALKAGIAAVGLKALSRSSGNNGGGLNFNHGQKSNNGWGQQSYADSYSNSYADSYNSNYGQDNEEVVKVIKIAVPRYSDAPQQRQVYYDNYAGSSSSASASSAASYSSYAPASTPSVQSYPAQYYQAAPAVQTYAPQPIQHDIPVAVQQRIQNPAPVYAQPQAQYAQAQTQYVQPQRQYVQPQAQYVQRSQPIYAHITIEKPIQYQYAVQQQQPSYQQATSVAESDVQALQQIEESTGGEYVNVPAQIYGPPPSEKTNC